MSDLEKNYSVEQISGLMKSQRRKGAERAFAYVFASSLLSAVITPLLGRYLESGEVVFSIAVVLCGAAYALVTSN